MFYLFRVEQSAKGYEFTKITPTSLAGSRSGLIVRHLRQITPKSATEPYQWHFRLEDALKRLDLEGKPNALVIDSQPNGKTVQLFQLMEVWGHSERDWTPILMRLRLLTEEDVDKARFALKTLPDEDVFTFLYLRGSVHKGEFVGGWGFPGPSPTNSAFLWPSALEYFMRAAGYAKRL